MVKVIKGKLKTVKAVKCIVTKDKKTVKLPASYQSMPLPTDGTRCVYKQYERTAKDGRIAKKESIDFIKPTVRTNTKKFMSELMKIVAIAFAAAVSKELQKA